MRVVAVLMLLSLVAFSERYDAKLDSAKVFLNGAELFHSVDVKLQKGENKIEVSGVAKGLNKSSLRSKINSKDALILSSSYEIDYNKNSDIKLTIKDQFPKSTNEDIKVFEHNIPSNAKRNEFDIITWNLELKAGERINTEFSYQLSYPKDKEVR
jgi:hypothetical protein